MMALMYYSFSMGMGVDWDSWNRLKASSVEMILGEKGKILGSFVTKLKITSLPCR